MKRTRSGVRVSDWGLSYFQNPVTVEYSNNQQPRPEGRGMLVPRGMDFMRV